MISITKVKQKDFQILSNIGKTSCIEPHGSSAATRDINTYLNEKFNNEVINEELSDSKNIYHIICHDNQPAGYSKIIFNAPHPNSQLKKCNYAGTSLFAPGVL